MRFYLIHNQRISTIDAMKAESCNFIGVKRKLFIYFDLQRRAEICGVEFLELSISNT